MLELLVFGTIALGWAVILFASGRSTPAALAGCVPAAIGSMSMAVLLAALAGQPPLLGLAALAAAGAGLAYRRRSVFSDRAFARAVAFVAASIALAGVMALWKGPAVVLYDTLRSLIQADGLSGWSGNTPLVGALEGALSRGLGYWGALYGFGDGSILRFVYQPVLWLCLLAASATLIVQRLRGDGVAAMALALAGLAAVYATPMVVQHGFAPMPHLAAAGALLAILVLMTDEPADAPFAAGPAFAIAALAFAAATLRIEMALVALLIILPILGRIDGSASTRAAALSPLVLLAVWQGFLTVLSLRFDALTSPLFFAGSAALAIGYLLADQLSIRVRVARRLLHMGPLLAFGAMTVAVAALVVLDLDTFVVTGAALARNLFWPGHLYGVLPLLYFVLLGVTALSLLRGAPSLRAVWPLVFAATYALLITSLGLLRDHPYRVGFGDSGSRMLLQLFLSTAPLVLIACVQGARLGRAARRRSADLGVSAVPPLALGGAAAAIAWFVGATLGHVLDDHAFDHGDDWTPVESVRYLDDGAIFTRAASSTPLTTRLIVPRRVRSIDIGTYVYGAGEPAVFRVRARGTTTEIEVSGPAGYQIVSHAFPSPVIIGPIDIECDRRGQPACVFDFIRLN